MSGEVLVTDEFLARWRPPAVLDSSDKEGRGRVIVLAAGPQLVGASLLTATAALRAGAGKLRIAAPASLVVPLSLAMPEARVFPAPETDAGEIAPEAAEALADVFRSCDAAVVGPGMLDEGPAGELALRIIEGEGPMMVVDAAAMRGLAENPERARRLAGRMVLTPHAGEMAGLAGCSKEDVLRNPLAVARKAASELKAVIALKGATTLIVSPDGSAWRHEAGHAGLATSGSGDVLAGVIAGLLARGCPPAQAAVWGVVAHARAGQRLGQRIARLGFLAREVADEVAPVLGELEMTNR